MSKKKIALTGALFVAAVLLTLSCATPMHLTDNWRSSTYTGPAYKKITVVAMTRQDNLRKPIEKEFVEQFKSRGVEAAAFHEHMADPDKGSVEDLIRLGQRMGTEAYLIVRVVGVGTVSQAYGSPDATSTSMQYIPWFGPQAPTIKQRDVATLDSRLYDGKTKDIVWRSTVDAVSPSGSDDQISRFVTLVIKALREKKLIPSF